MAMALETAIERAFNMMNSSGDDEDLDIYKYMYRYQAIRNLPNDKFEEVYEYLASRLGFNRRKGW